MKPIALALLLFASPLIAADKPTTPDFQNGSWHMFCVKAKGLDLMRCGVSIIPNPEDSGFKEHAAGLALILGFDAANAYFPPPLTKQQEKYREAGQKVMASAPRIAFPELGEAVTKDTPAVAYCSSSLGKGIIDPWDAPDVFFTKASGKGGCSDLILVYLRPAGK